MHAAYCALCVSQELLYKTRHHVWETKWDHIFFAYWRGLYSHQLCKRWVECNSFDAKTGKGTENSHGTEELKKNEQVALFTWGTITNFWRIFHVRCSWSCYRSACCGQSHSVSTVSRELQEETQLSACKGATGSVSMSVWSWVGGSSMDSMNLSSQSCIRVPWASKSLIFRKVINLRLQKNHKINDFRSTKYKTFVFEI